MKMFFQLLFILFILFLSINVNAGWYPLDGIAVDYDSSSPVAECGSSQCETDPYETYCFNSEGGTTQTGDNLPSGDDRSAVDLPSPDSGDSSPIYLDDPSDNENHDGDQQLDTTVDREGTMYCYYRDKVKFHKSTYELYDYNFLTFGIANGNEKDFKIDFQLKTLVDGTEDNTRIDSEDGIDSLYLTFTFYDNTELNHFTNSSGSAVEALNTDSDTIDVNTHLRTITYNITSSNLSTYTDGNNEFLFKYKFYNSTIGDAITLRDDFVLKTINYDITFNGGASYNGIYIYSGNNGGEINDVSELIYLNPLIELSNTGVIFGTGLVEGTTQTGKLTVINNDSSVSISSTGVYLSMTGITSNPDVVDEFTGTGKIDDGDYKDIDKDNLINNFISILSDGTEYILKTLFVLVDGDGTVDDIVDLRVREFIKYTVGGKTVIYLAGIINQTNNNSFETLKIYGRTNISSYKQKDLLEDQDGKDIQNLAGSITKSLLKRDIKKAAINTTKFIDTSGISNSAVNDITGNIWNSSNGGKELGNILYYKIDDGSNVELGDGSDLSVEGRKTLVVVGGNVRITENIFNRSKNDILGIISLKGKNGLGGNVYINTDVDEVDAIIYAEKSVISYNDNYDNGYVGENEDIIKHEVDANIDDNVLDNQLYIVGSVFSENTIGASRLDPPICPFWTTIEGIDCDKTEAQKYDFNYLRTGLGEDPYFSGDSNTGLNYPVVIKYNSIVQSITPPLLGQ